MTMAKVGSIYSLAFAGQVEDISEKLDIILPFLTPVTKCQLNDP